MIVRPLVPDFDWGQYMDLTARSFGPMDETRVQPDIEPVVSAGRCLGAYDGDRLVGAAFALFDSFDRTRRCQMHAPLAADR